MIPSFVAGVLLLLTGREVPPKYMEGQPLRECAAWVSVPTACCGWRGPSKGLVACHQGDDRGWYVVARSTEQGDE